MYIHFQSFCNPYKIYFTYCVMIILWKVYRYIFIFCILDKNNFLFENPSCLKPNYSIQTIRMDYNMEDKIWFDFKQYNRYCILLFSLEHWICFQFTLCKYLIYPTSMVNKITRKQKKNYIHLHIIFFISNKLPKLSI